MVVAIYGRKLKPEVKEGVVLLFQLLKENNIQIRIYKPFYKHIKELFNLDVDVKTFTTRAEFEQEVEFVFSLGGDGTILDTVSWVGEYQIPIVGINMGRLGFLASIPIDKIS
ncbi:MAG: NAD+ kinase, partial [Planctomycetota bacterium]